MRSHGILAVAFATAVLCAGFGSVKPGLASELNDLEKEFVEMMTDSVLYGTFRLTTKEGLSPAQDEAYYVKGVRKIHGENWSVECRIVYGSHDVTVPIPIKVFWVQDTPIISVTDLMVPGIGTYTSRVQVYRGCYAGTWFGKGYGGTLSGRILKRSAYEKMKGEGEKKSEKKESAKY